MSYLLKSCTINRKRKITGEDVSETEHYSKGGLAKNLHGSIYQLKLLMLFLLNGSYNSDEFHLFTEWNAAESLDDLTFEFVKDGKRIYIFLQAKHRRDRSKKLTRNDLLNETDGDFSILKYFISFRKIYKQNFNFEQHDGKKIFILCTNIDMDEKLRVSFEEVKDEGDILDVKSESKESKRYNLILDKLPAKDKIKIIDLLKTSTTIHQLAKKIADCVKSKKKMQLNEPIFKAYHCLLKKHNIIDIGKKKFHDDFIKNENLSDVAGKFREILLTKLTDENKLNKMLKLSDAFGRCMQDCMLNNPQISNAEKLAEAIVDQFNICTECNQGAESSLLEDKVTDKDIEDFFNQFQFAVNQPDEIELQTIMENSLNREFNKADSKNAYCQLLVEMLDWLKQKDGVPLSFEKVKELLDDIRSRIKGPTKFGVHGPVYLFTGREKELEALHDKMNVSSITCVSGLGGIGKTQLVRKYVDGWASYYDHNIIWINAEMMNCFNKLSGDAWLGISTKNKDGTEKSRETIVKEVYACFSKKRCLFIFDNVSDSKLLHEFLPESSSEKMNILITSYICEWEKPIEVLILEQLEHDEAIELVKNGLNINQTSFYPLSTISKLVDKLQCFPLAIMQAIAYVLNEQDLQPTYELETFTNEFDNKCDSFFHSDPFVKKILDNKYTKTIFTVWTMAIEQIQKNHDCGWTATSILTMIAYFAAANINRQTLLYLAHFDDFNSMFNPSHAYGRLPKQEKVRKIQEAIHLLVKYCMINGEQKQSELSVHRLVQVVIKLHLKSQNKTSEAEIMFSQLGGERAAVRNAFNLLSLISLDLDGLSTLESRKARRQLLPHLEALIAHLYKLNETQSEELISHLKDRSLSPNISLNENKFTDNLIERLLRLLEEGYRENENLKGLRELLLREKKLRSDEYPEGSVALAKIQTKIEHIESVIEKTDETSICQPSPVLAEKLFNRGRDFRDLQDFDKGHELLQQALAIYAGLGSDYEKNVALVKLNLAIIYNNLYAYKKAKTLLGQAVPVFQKEWEKGDSCLIESDVNLCVAVKALGEGINKEAMARIEAIYTNKADCLSLVEALSRVYNGYTIIEDLSIVEDMFNDVAKRYDPLKILAANIWKNLGNIYADNRKIEPAQIAYQKASNLQGKSSSLDFACMHGNEEIIEQMWKGQKYVSYKDMLFKAALGDSVEVINFIINEIQNVDVKNTEGDTPIMWAAINGNVRSAQRFLELGANCVEKNNNSETVLHKAVLGKHGAMVEIIVKRIKDKYPENYLEHFNDKDENGNTALILAARCGNVNAVRILSADRQDCFVNENNATVLHYAVYSNDELTIDDIVDEMEKKTKNFPDHIDVEDREGNTPLMWAVEEGKFNAANALLRKKACVDTENNSNETVLHKAVLSDSELITELVVRYIAESESKNLNSKDVTGETALMSALKKRKCFAARTLMKYDVKLFVRYADKGESILHYAVMEDDEDLITTIIEKMTDKFRINVDDDDANAGNTEAERVLAFSLEYKNHPTDGFSTFCNTIISDNETIVEIFREIILRNVEEGTTPIASKPNVHVLRAVLKKLSELANLQELDKDILMKGPENIIKKISEHCENKDSSRISCIQTHQRNKKGSKNIDFQKYIDISKINTMKQSMPSNALGSHWIGIFENGRFVLRTANIGHKYSNQVYTDICKKIETHIKKKIINDKDRTGYTPFMRAVKQRKVNAALKLIEHGADANGINNDALQKAAEKRDFKLCRSLLDKYVSKKSSQEQGMDTNSQGEESAAPDSQRPLITADQSEDYNIFLGSLVKSYKTKGQTVKFEIRDKNEALMHQERNPK